MQTLLEHVKKFGMKYNFITTTAYDVFFGQISDCDRFW
jgi:hypothetical protein